MALKRELHAMHAELLHHKQHNRDNTNAALVAERHLRQEMEVQKAEMQQRIVALQAKLDDYEQQQEARVEAATQLLADRQHAVESADEAIAAMRAKLEDMGAEKEAKDAEAKKVLLFLQDSQALAQQLTEDKAQLASQLALVQQQYQEACLKLLGESRAGDALGVGNLSHISDSLTPPSTGSKGNLPNAARLSGIHRMTHLSLDWDASVDASWKPLLIVED